VPSHDEADEKTELALWLDDPEFQVGPDSVTNDSGGTEERLEA
jgi:hypothetical protein